MAIARLHGGPLDGELLPIEDESLESYIAPYGEGQLVYERRGEATGTGAADGPTTTDFWYVEATEDVNPNEDGRDD